MNGFESLQDFLTWLKEAPDGTRIDAATVAGILEGVSGEEVTQKAELTVESPGGWTWAERIWVVPAERRLGTSEVLEAIGRGKSWLWDRMHEKHGPDRIPHRKLDGELVFTAGELRAWVRDQESVIAGGRMQSTPEERRGLLRAS